MAAANLLALLDDIASILDDVGILTKVAAQKTSGVVGDDLALNAQQVSGVRAERELPVVWAVAKGSLVNKAILVPAALAISALAPWGIGPLLMVGGTYLCFEGFEKVVHTLDHRRRHAAEKTVTAPSPPEDPSSAAHLEAQKIRGAIRTDFVLSAEIVTIALGMVSSARFLTQVLALAAIGVVMTVGVYGLVAVIVKLDDVGAYLYSHKEHSVVGGLLGRAILAVAPLIMKSLTVVGTIAMFLVGGSIMAHQIAPIQGVIHPLVASVHHLGSLAEGILTNLSNGLLGLLLGAAAFLVVLLGKTVFLKR